MRKTILAVLMVVIVATPVFHRRLNQLIFLGLRIPFGPSNPTTVLHSLVSTGAMFIPVTIETDQCVLHFKTAIVLICSGLDCQVFSI
jgi:hypothetical protein